MSLYSQLRGIVVVPSKTHPANVVIVPSDDEVKRRLANYQPIMNDGAVPVLGVRIGWKRTAPGILTAVCANPLTNQRELHGLDLRTRQPVRVKVLPHS
jgi:hypothetical protein